VKVSPQLGILKRGWPDGAESSKMSDKRNLNTLIEKAFDAISILNLEQEVIYASPSTLRVVGRKPSEWVGQNPFVWVHPEDAERVTETWLQLLQHQGSTVRIQLRFRHAEGHYIWIDCTATNLLNDPEVQGIVCNYLDITLQKNGEIERANFLRVNEEFARKRLERINNLLKLLEQFNRAVLHTHEETALLKNFCQLATDICGYRLVWIGQAGEPPLKRIEPVAHAGNENGYLNAIELYWDDQTVNKGPARNAITSASPVVIRDIANEASFRYKQAALERGYKSCAVLPLQMEKHVHGLLLVYADEVDAFQAEEIQLLGRAADDLSHGILLIRASAARKAAEITLAQKEEFFREMTENSLDVVSLIDPELKIVYESPSTEQVFGYKKGELEGRPVLEYLHPDDIPLIQKLKEEQATNPTDSNRLEIRFRHKNGDWRVVESYARPLKGSSSFQGFVIHTRDITDRIRAEAALKESEWLYHSTFEGAPNGMAHMDLAGRYLKVNRRFCELLQYTPEELLQMTFRDITHPQDLLEDERAVKEALQGRVTRHRAEKRYIRKDGVVIWCVRTATAHYDANGCLKHCLVAVEDITEQKRAQERIIEQANLINLARDAIFVRDLNGVITFWNQGAERIYGWRASEVLGKKIEEVLPSDPAEYIRCNEQLIESGEWSGELHKKTRDQREVILSSRWTLLQNKEDQRASVMVIDTDITEKKRLEIEFYRAQRMEGIGTLASGIAHDLNNILAPIMMSAELMQCGMKPADQAQALKTILDSAQRGAEIVKQVLTFGRGVKGEKSVLQPKHLVKEMIKIARETFPRSIRVESDLNGDLPPIIGDATQMHQVLLNLAINARDAMPKGGTLALNAEPFHVDQTFAARHTEARPGDFIHFWVSDSGTGISPEHLEHIFLPFYTTKEQGKGTGLGLSTVLGIVKNHNGFVHVESTPGKGSTFHIYIPAARGSCELRSKSARVEPPSGNGQTILVVDDEPSLRSITQQTLEKKGYNVIAAADGVEGFSAYAQARGKIDLVLTDIMMPVMDGVVLAIAIRRLDPVMPIIATSGLACDQELTNKLEELRDLGISALLNKPCHSDTLLTEVARAIHRSPALVSRN
jgi:PAS domain S-box-containing protein